MMISSTESTVTKTTNSREGGYFLEPYILQKT